MTTFSLPSPDLYHNGQPVINRPSFRAYKTGSLNQSILSPLAPDSVSAARSTAIYQPARDLVLARVASKETGVFGAVFSRLTALDVWRILTLPFSALLLFYRLSRPRNLSWLLTCRFHSLCSVTFSTNLKETTSHRASTRPRKSTPGRLSHGFTNTMRPFHDEAQKPLLSCHVSFLNGGRIVFSAYQQDNSKR
jgi:hypothetical protein